MIQLDRGAEPEPLKKIRIRELKRVKAIAQLRAPTSDDIGDAYQIARRTLWERQSYKCCFCEFKEQHDYNDVEHYRPKAEVLHARGGTSRPGYWWLSWTWANLMFACQSCNRSFKRTWFPLDEASVPLKPLAKPPGREKPLLINPFEENPVDHIQFREVMVEGRRRWIPFSRDRSEKGRWTIEITGLDRATLLDLYEDHFANFVEPHLDAIRKAFEKNDLLTIEETWRKETKRLLNRRCAFAGLTYDALDAAFPEAVRRSRELNLIRP